jgi:2-succinyl-5-enolpyruvyl-6-hydroxy-3-cyclohexene-1-carboxylate synthase
VIVVVQNDGGRIFERLPIARAASGASSAPSREAFDRCFTTPQHLDFAPAASMFGLAYERVDTPAALSAALASAHARASATLIEAVVPPSDAAARAARIAAALRASLSDPPPDEGLSDRRARSPEKLERKAS